MGRFEKKTAILEKDREKKKIRKQKDGNYTETVLEETRTNESQRV